METDQPEIKSRSLRRAATRLLPAVALSLAVMLAMPAWAAGDRAVKERVPPVYPEIAKRLKIAGTVVVEATVDANGRVGGVKTVSGNRMLSIAAEDAVRKWKFESGSGTDTVDVQVNFSLRQ
jgi:TonB family protein